MSCHWDVLSFVSLTRLKSQLGQRKSAAGGERTNQYNILNRPKKSNFLEYKFFV